MSAPPVREILSIDPEVERLLGKTFDEIAKMGLGAFAELSYDRGIVWTVSPDGGRIKGLTIRIKRDQSEIATS